MSTPNQNRKFLVTGASGYVGGRLVRALIDENSDVRILVRDKNKILGQLRDNLRDWLSGDMEQTSKHYPAANMINADPYGDAYAAVP